MAKAEKKDKKDEKVEEVKEKKEDKWSDDEWDEDNLEDDMEKDDEDEESLDDIDQSKLKFTKIKNLKPGMEDVNVDGTIDFVGEKSGGSSYGDSIYVQTFLKDKTGEVKMTFWNDDIVKVKIGVKVRIVKGNVTEFRGTTQLNNNRALGVVFL